MKRMAGLLAASVLLSSCAAAYLRPSEGDIKPLQQLEVVILGSPEFKVLDVRAKGLGVGVLFGAVGLAVNSALTNSLDADTESELEPQSSQISYREFFIRQLRDSLEQSKRFQGIHFIDESAKGRIPGDAVLELSIQEWGIKLINQHAHNLVPFITVEIKLTDRNGKVLWKERDVEVGTEGHTVEEYRSQEHLLRDTLQMVLKDTAARITSTLVYN